MPKTNALTTTGRVLLALLFLFGAYSKVSAPAGTQGYIASVGLPAPIVAYLFSTAIEAAGGILLLIGYQTRYISIALAAFTLLVTIIFHTDFADQGQVIHFIKNFAIIGGLLQLAAHGAGAASIDARHNRAS